MADGLLTQGLNYIDQQKQALAARLGLLMNNPQEFAAQLGSEARQRAGVGLLGEPKTAQEMASGAWINSPYGQQAMQAGSGFAGTVIGKPIQEMKVFRAGAEEGLTAKSGGPTFFSLDIKGTEPFSKTSAAKEYSISPKNIIDASKGEGIKLYKDFIKETNSPAGYGNTARPYWTSEYDFRNWLREKKIPFDAIMFDEPTGVPSIAIYK